MNEANMLSRQGHPFLRNGQEMMLSGSSPFTNIRARQIELERMNMMELPSGSEIRHFIHPDKEGGIGILAHRVDKSGEPTQIISLRWLYRLIMMYVVIVGLPIPQLPSWARQGEKECMLGIPQFSEHIRDRCGYDNLFVALSKHRESLHIEGMAFKEAW